MRCGHTCWTTSARPRRHGCAGSMAGCRKRKKRRSLPISGTPRGRARTGSRLSSWSLRPRSVWASTVVTSAAYSSRAPQQTRPPSTSSWAGRAVMRPARFPAPVRLTPGALPPRAGPDPDAVLARAARAWVEAEPGRAARASVTALPAALARAGAAGEDPAATWAALVELHHAGVLDVSAAPNRRWLTSLRIHRRTIPSMFSAAVSTRRRRAADELAALPAWYADTARCATLAVADYLAPVPPGQVPPGTCSTPPCRCSTCWARVGTGTLPKELAAGVHPAHPPHTAVDDRLRRARP